jgi:hypothetical protein
MEPLIRGAHNACDIFSHKPLLTPERADPENNSGTCIRRFASDDFMLLHLIIIQAACPTLHIHSHFFKVAVNAVTSEGD